MPTILTYQILPSCPVTPTGGTNVNFGIEVQFFENVTGDTLVWTKRNGDLPSDLTTDIQVYQNGKLLDYPAEYTIFPYSGAGESTFTIASTVPPFDGAYYRIVAFYYD